MEISKDNNLIAVSTKQNMQRNKILTLVESFKPSTKIDSVAPTRAANSRMEWVIIIYLCTYLIITIRLVFCIPL